MHVPVVSGIPIMCDGYCYRNCTIMRVSVGICSYVEPLPRHLGLASKP